MRGCTLIGLTVLALLQGGWLLWEIHHGDAPPAEARRVIELERDRIDSLEIRRHGSPTVELRRSGEQWLLLRPLQDAAADEAVDRILTAADFLESWRSPPAKASSASLGLEAPAVELILHAGTRRQELRLGGLDPSQQGVYLEISGKRLVVARSLFDAVNRGADDLRERALVGLARDGLRRITRSGEQPFELVREASGSWWQQSSKWRMPVAPEASERLIAALLGLHASRFLATTSVVSAATIVRAEGEGREAELHIGGVCPGHPVEAVVSARRSGAWVQACVDLMDLAALRAPARSLLDLALTQLDEPELAAITIRSRAGVTELRRQAGSWRLSDGAAADTQEIQTWLEELRSVRGVLTTTERRPSGDGTIELRREVGGGERLSFGQGLAERDGMQGVALALGPAAIHMLAVPPLRFRDRQLWHFSPREVRRLRVERGEVVVEVKREEGQWQVTRPGGASLDTERLQTLLERLAHLQADKFLVERVPRTRSDQVFRLELDPEPLSGHAAPSRRVLELWSEGDADRCGGKVGDAPPFALDSKACQELRADLLRRP